jgi:hypothetical protein
LFPCFFNAKSFEVPQVGWHSGNFVEIKKLFSGVLSARSVAKPTFVFKRHCATFARCRKEFRSISRNFPEALTFLVLFVARQKVTPKLVENESLHG